jgi:pyruvate formate lyase activating enzyme
VRFNENGQLKVPFGYVAGLQADPVEKKPFYHFLPGSTALTFGMLGCDFHCAYCQNWVTSQALRDPASLAPIQVISADQIVATARRANARMIVSSYNEPLITAEWAAAVFEKARSQGFLCAFVSNGNATPEVLDFIAPFLAAYKVDLKCFNDRNYRQLGGVLSTVTESIARIHERRIWVEVVTLLVPGFNDSEAELRAMAHFLASVSQNIPWHVTAFHPDYKMTDPANTTASDLLRAAEIGVEEGLRFVYAGNAAGRVGEWEHTRCPGCARPLVKRRGYHILENLVTSEGKCPTCSAVVPGIWA